MEVMPTTNWNEQNQQYLFTALAPVRTRLQRYVNQRNGHTVDVDAAVDANVDVFQPVNASLQAIAQSMSLPPALESLCATFGLSSFERHLLLLCAGVDLDGTFAALCAAAQGDPQRIYPTFSLAMAVLPDPNWGAFTPTAALRRWRLIEVTASTTFTLSPLRLSERVLHYIAGFQHLDERLLGLVDLVRADDDLVPSHRALVEQLVTAWSRLVRKPPLPAIQLTGDERASKGAIAAAVCAGLGLKLHAIAADTLPTNPAELESLMRLWARDAALLTSALLIDCTTLDPADAARVSTLTRLTERVNGVVFVSTQERLQLLQRPTVTFDVTKPRIDEQRVVWRSVLGPAAESLNGQIDLLVTQFNLGAPAIRAASAEVFGRMPAGDHSDLGTTLWNICRSQARPRMDDLAQRIDSPAAWDDLVLPEAQRQTLRDIASHVRQRSRVYEQWGFSQKGSRGLGISGLFAGQSGTGKTLAAEVLANTLNLDLYRIDLSAVVSKYIGETEKNLRRIFDAAEEGGAILLFDEADALFGKRSEVKDSHDRYANIEVSYLLQRMESYRGLAILTTNLKSALDTAFLRRIRFVVQFPFPDATQRTAIWRRVFPQNAPTANLKWERLGQLNVAGGNIRNIALNAAFLAADEPEAGNQIQMRHVLRAARSEYAKLEKTLTEAEITDWV